jgi:hypothetical protein
MQHARCYICVAGRIGRCRRGQYHRHDLVAVGQLG